MLDTIAVLASTVLSGILFAQQPTSAGGGLQSGRAGVPGGALYWEARGSGPVVILLHGGLLDTRMWDEQFEVFAGAFRVVRYDARLHGRSSPSSGDYNNADDLHALMSALGIRKASLVGLSLGARTALDFALLHPDMVEALVAVSPGISGWDFNRDPVLQERQAGLRKAAVAGDLDACVEWFQRSWTDGASRKASDVNPAVREKVRVMARAGAANVLRNKGTLQELNAAARVGEIGVPTLAVLGDLDMADIHGIVDLIAAKVPGARKVVIRGAAHMVNMEKPEEFNRVVLEFLRAARNGRQ